MGHEYYTTHNLSQAQNSLILFGLLNPILFYLSYKTHSFVVKLALFICKTLLILLIVYPTGNNFTLWLFTLLVFIGETSIIFKKHWWISFFFILLLMTFTHLLPNKIWGIQRNHFELYKISLLLLFSLNCIFITHYLFLLSETLKKHNQELVLQYKQIEQVYLLNSTFQEYALTAENRSALNERKRITRDIHDIMGYTLVNLRVMLEVSLDLVEKNNQKLYTLLQDAIEHTRNGLQAARRDLRNLREIEKPHEPWINKLYNIAKIFSEATGIHVSVFLGNVTLQNCPFVKNAVFQFVQEALTNAYRHGHASDIQIDLRIEQNHSEHLIVRVIDNGIGSDTIVPGIGFSGIIERVKELEGCTEYTNLESGFQILIKIPLLALKKNEPS